MNLKIMIFSSCFVVSKMARALAVLHIAKFSQQPYLSIFSSSTINAAVA